jgi:chemotaxis protein CheY-P-specific phosphatase CheC
METDRQEKLNVVLEGVLEQFAFMFCEPTTSDDLGDPGEQLLHASMAFTGHGKGIVDIAAPVGFAKELAANALGIDEDEEAEDAAQDALKELLNIICGQTLTTLLGETPVFDLTVPEVTPYTADDWEELLNDEKVAHYMVDGYPLLLHVDLKEEPE